MTHNDTPRNIETEIQINAPLEAVWKALAEADELTNWFPPEAEIKPGVGGHVRYIWTPQQDWTAAIDAWEPNRHIRIIYAEPTSEGDAMHIPFRVAVDYHLEARNGVTVLRLVHSGFSSDGSWDAQYDGTVRGWNFELRGMKHYLEHHRGKKRRVVHVVRPLDAAMSLDQAWKHITSAEGLCASGSLDKLAPGDGLDITTAAGDHMCGDVLIINPPQDLCATVASMDNSFLRLKIDEPCMTAPNRELHLWLSTYGWSQKDVDAMQTKWEAMADRAFAAQQVSS